jgi:outer membrane receptor protein involved in Fe transport
MLAAGKDRVLAGRAAILLAMIAAGGALAAEDAPRQVQPVVVTARKPKTETLIDRTVYDVKTDLQSATGTAADVLQNLPSVEVDADGNVTLRGDPNVLILIDGKPSTQFSGSMAGLGLQQLSAAEIDRVEVMTTPPAQFKAEGSAGVINIITKKTRRAGFSGLIQANVGDKRRFQTGVAGSWSVGKLTLGGTLTVRRDYRHRIVADARTAVDPATGLTVISQEAVHETLQRLSELVKLKADYALGPKTMIGVAASHQELTGHRYFDQQDASADAGGAPLSASTRASDGHEWDQNTGAEAHFDQKLWRPDETLSLSVKRTATRERERYAYVDSFALPAAPQSQEHLHLTLNLITTEAAAAYDLPLSHGGDLKLGYDFEDQDNSFHDFGDTVDPTSGTLIPNPNVTYDFRFRQQIHAAYGEYQRAFGPWSTQAGVRFEHTSAKAGLAGGPATTNESYTRIYPSLHLERAIGGASKVIVSVARRENRPDPEALNPFADHQDIYNLRAGNPNLLPEDVWSYEAGYAYDHRGLTLGATAYYRFSRDAVTDIVRPLTGNVVLITKTNLPKSRSGGLEATASGRLLPKLSYALSGNLFYNQINTAALGLPGLRSTVGFNAKASLDWRPTGRDLAQVSFTRSDKRLTPQGYIGAINLVNLGYRRQLSPRLALVATASDVLNGQVFRRFVVTPVLNDSYSRQQLGQVVFVGFTYSFGGPKKASNASFDYDQ